VSLNKKEKWVSLSQLSLQKKKNFENFKADKLSKKSASYQDDVLRTLRRLDDYSALTHSKSRNEIIEYLRSINDIEERENETIGWIQGFIDKISDNDKISFKVLQVYLSHVKKYLKYYKIRVDFGEDIELPSALLEERYAIPIDDIRQIIENAPWKYKGYFLSLVSSGARPIEIMSLRKKDFTWTGKRWRSIIPAKYTKKKISRTVFFSLEVTPYLNKLLKDGNDDNRIWTKNVNLPDDKLTGARQNAGVMFRKICNKIGFTQRYETTNFYKYNMYCYRACFFTRALDSLNDSKDMAHAMIGHGAYLDQYQRRTDEEKEQLYEEVESSILIFDQTKNIEKIRKLKEANKKVNELEIKIEAIEKRSNMPTIPMTELSESVRKILKENPGLLKS